MLVPNTNTYLLTYFPSYGDRPVFAPLLQPWSRSLGLSASMHSSVLLLLCVPSASAALLPRLRPPPRRLEAVVLDADGSFLDPDHKVCH